MGSILNQNIIAKRTYISENLNQTQRDFIILLDENEIDIFTLEDVKKIIPSISENANEIIENLIHKKMISRIERGKYCKVNFRDEKVIACLRKCYFPDYRFSEDLDFTSTNKDFELTKKVIK